MEIKIAPVVTRELEEQKTVNQVRKLKERAATAVKLLYKYLAQKVVREGVSLDFVIKEPSAEYAASRGLNLQLGDDWLIGTFLLYRDEHPGNRCVIATNDLPMTVKASHYQIECLSLDESLQLPSEPDPLEKKNRQLEAEMLRLKSREPVLDVRFEDGQEFARFKIRPLIDPSESEAEIQSKLEVIKQKTPLVALKAPQPQLDPATVANNPLAEMMESMRRISEPLETFGRQFYGDYNARAEAYHRDYEVYLRSSAALKSAKTRTIRLRLFLHNGGTCPAEDIHVLLHFPDGLMPYDEEHPPKEPKEPVAPSKEMSLMPGAAYLYPDIRSGLPQPRNPNLPKIRKTNSHEVTYHCDRLKHGFVWSMMPLYIVFDSADSAKSFSIDYTIHAGNMLDERTGKLGVVIEKD